MEEKNELNDIILNKSGSNGGNKKLLLAVATLALILIIVIVIMNSLQSEGTNNLPQAVLPPEPATQTVNAQEDPLFEPVEVIEENVDENDKLNKIAQKLKEESMQNKGGVSEEEVVIIEPEPLTPPKAASPSTVVERVPEKPATVQKTVAKPAPSKPAAPAAVAKGTHYIQVGSFSRLSPSDALLKKIQNNGMSYILHNVEMNGKTITKVLVGPFESEKDARKSLNTVRQKIEAGAFLTKV